MDSGVIFGLAHMRDRIVQRDGQYYLDRRTEQRYLDPVMGSFYYQVQELAHELEHIHPAMDIDDCFKEAINQLRPLM